MAEAPNGAATGWRARLVDDCHEWHKWWSLRIAALGGLVEAVINVFPSVLSSLPQVMQDDFPKWFAVALPFAISLARVWKQKPKTDDGGN